MFGGVWVAETRRWPPLQGFFLDDGIKERRYGLSRQMAAHLNVPGKAGQDMRPPQSLWLYC